MMPPVETAEAGNPPSVPWEGGVVMVHVSVLPGSRSKMRKKVSMAVAPEDAQMLMVCDIPWVNTGGWSITLLMQHTFRMVAPISLRYRLPEVSTAIPPTE